MRSQPCGTCALPSASAAICSPELAAARDRTCPFQWVRRSDRDSVYPNAGVAFLCRSREKGGGLLVLLCLYTFWALAAFEGSLHGIWLPAC